MAKPIPTLVWRSLAIAMVLTIVAVASAQVSDPAKREDLRYGGKSFEQWRHQLRTELKPEVRIERRTGTLEQGKVGREVGPGFGRQVGRQFDVPACHWPPGRKKLPESQAVL